MFVRALSSEISLTIWDRPPAVIIPSIAFRIKFEMFTLFAWQYSLWGHVMETVVR
ncbi:MAG: hypothetical protein ACYDFT_00345 [Thermoplasmata archaeon]